MKPFWNKTVAIVDKLEFGGKRGGEDREAVVTPAGVRDDIICPSKREERESELGQTRHA